MATHAETRNMQQQPHIGSSVLNFQLQRFGLYSSVTLFTIFLATVFLMPFAYGGLTAFKNRQQIIDSARGSILPMTALSAAYTPVYEYNDELLTVYEVQPTEGITRRVSEWALVNTNEETGEQFFIDTRNEDPYTVVDNITEIRGNPTEIEIRSLSEDLPLYKVEIDGVERELAALDRKPEFTIFIDPDNPYEQIRWEGRYLTLGRVQEFDPQTNNFSDAWNQADFPLLFRNTFAIAILGLIGTLISSVCVGYAFARFPLPYKNVIFLILISTIILPNQVRLVPTYAFYSKIGWTGTWLPLIVPHFFANAYNVFLFRQYFLTLPREMDEAAMIDGAGPLTILIRIIVPQSWPVIVAVGLFHFVFAWNDYFEPLIYLLGRPDLVPISVGIQQFNFIYDQQPHLIQATSLLALIVPIFVFFFSQRFFMRGVVITGVEK